MDPKDAILAIRAGKHVYEDPSSSYHILTTWYDDPMKKPLWRIERDIYDVRCDLAERFWCKNIEDVVISQAGPRCVYIKYDVRLQPHANNTSFFTLPTVSS